MTIPPVAELGWRLLPVRLSQSSKVPAIKGWQARATSDQDQLRAWDREFPGAGWGAVTGEGWIVVDLDGETGVGNFRDLLDEEGEAWPETPLAETRRGLHFYFRCADERIGCSARRLPAASMFAARAD